MTEENTLPEEQVNLSMQEELTQALMDAEKQQPEEVTEESEEGTLEEVTEEEVVEEDSEDEIEKQVEEELPLIPKDWSKDEKEVFEALLNSDDEDKRVAAEVLIERYNSLKKGFYNKTMEYSQKTKEFDEIDKVFQPFKQVMEANNMPKAQYIQNMVQWEQALHNKPVEAVKLIMQNFGVKPQDIVPRDNYYDEYEDDYEPQESKKIASLEAELKNLRNQMTNQPILEQIRQFASATDSEGKLLHPRFEEVKEIMGTLMHKDKSLDLNSAYKKATRLFEEDQPDNQSPVNLDEIRKRVAKSKKAQKSVKTAASRQDTSNMSIKDELLAQFNKQ